MHEERLRKLKLEREFQRRADEHSDGDDDDEAMMERAEQRERMLSIQQDIERTRLRRLEQRYGSEQQFNGGTGKVLNKTLEEQEERLKQLRLEEEATQQAEERLLQEAKKRQSNGVKVSSNLFEALFLEQFFLFRTMKRNRSARAFSSNPC